MKHAYAYEACACPYLSSEFRDLEPAQRAIQLGRRQAGVVVSIKRHEGLPGREFAPIQRQPHKRCLRILLEIHPLIRDGEERGKRGFLAGVSASVFVRLYQQQQRQCLNFCASQPATCARGDAALPSSTRKTDRARAWKSCAARESASPRWSACSACRHQRSDTHLAPQPSHDAKRHYQPRASRYSRPALCFQARQTPLPVTSEERVHILLLLLLQIGLKVLTLQAVDGLGAGVARGVASQPLPDSRPPNSARSAPDTTAHSRASVASLFCQYLYLCTIKASTFVLVRERSCCNPSAVSICPFVLVKQVLLY